MITFKGRVVYDRIEHKFKAKDIARILYAETSEMTAFETGLFVSEVLFRIIVKWAREPISLADFVYALTKEWAGIVVIQKDLPPADEELEKDPPGGPSGDSSTPSSTSTGENYDPTMRSSR